MKIKYTNIIRHDDCISYEFDGETITTTYTETDGTEHTDTFNLSVLEEGDKLVDVETSLPRNPIDFAERVDGELKVGLLMYHGNLQQGAEYPSQEWQEVE